MRPIDECIFKSNEEFLWLLDSLNSSSEQYERLRILCRLNGYLRFLFFEILEENVQNASGGDLSTLICGIPVVIEKSIDLCEISSEEREVICGIVMDSLSLALLMARKLGRDGYISEVVRDIQAKLQEKSELDDELRILLRSFSDSFIRLFR
ncbi:MAG: hypothetical protein QXJ48_00470 [Candidatus Korarchaeum sp.]